MNLKLVPEKDYALYYRKYVDLVEGNVLDELSRQVDDLRILLPLNDQQLHFQYAEGKWTIKEILGHLIDTERVMTYRALRFARKDDIELPAFDENQYVLQASFNKRSIASLCEEFRLMRESHLLFFSNLTQEQLLSKGTAAAQPVTVAAVLYIIAGHFLHHFNIIQQRYLLP